MEPMPVLVEEEDEGVPPPPPAESSPDTVIAASPGTHNELARRKADAERRERAVGTSPVQPLKTELIAKATEMPPPPAATISHAERAAVLADSLSARMAARRRERQQERRNSNGGGASRAASARPAPRAPAADLIKEEREVRMHKLFEQLDRLAATQTEEGAAQAERLRNAAATSASSTAKQLAEQATRAIVPFQAGSTSTAIVPHAGEHLATVDGQTPKSTRAAQWQTRTGRCTCAGRSAYWPSVDTSRRVRALHRSHCPPSRAADGTACPNDSTRIGQCTDSSRRRSAAVRRTASARPTVC